MNQENRKQSKEMIEKSTTSVEQSLHIIKKANKTITDTIMVVSNIDPKKV